LSSDIPSGVSELHRWARQMKQPNLALVLVIAGSIALRADDSAQRPADRSSEDLPSQREIGHLPTVRNRDAEPIDGWIMLKRQVEFPPGDLRFLVLTVECAVDSEGKAHGPVRIRGRDVGEQKSLKVAILRARYYPPLKDFEAVDGRLYRFLEVKRSEGKSAQPGATDNPDGA